MEFHDKEMQFPAIKGQPYKANYPLFWKKYKGTDNEDDRRIMLRTMFRNDLFFLLYYGLSRHDINDYTVPFVVDMCKQVEHGPFTDTLDLWSRGHYKSSIITQGRTLQDLLRDPENMTVGFFSHVRPLAKSFMLPIKVALEGNRMLRWAFPDIIWENPKRDAAVWSMDTGLELMRNSISNTHSLEAWGLVDGMPAGKHFQLRVYDDVVTEKTTSTPEMMRKAEVQMRLSVNLGTDDGWQRIIGTIYRRGDFYTKCQKDANDGIYPYHVRVVPWFKGFYTPEEATTLKVSEDYKALFGYRKPVLLTWEQILKKYKQMLDYIFRCQMELTPAEAAESDFREEWIKYYHNLPTERAKFLFIDPANEKKRDSDYTVMAVVSMDSNRNRFLEDMVRDRLDLGQRWQAIKKLLKDNAPIMTVFYESYGKDSDEYYFRQQMEAEGTYFNLVEIGGKTHKFDRIRRLVMPFRERRFFLPRKGIWYLGEDLVNTFIEEEYLPFPFCDTYDMLDAISRIEDPAVEEFIPVSQYGFGKKASEIQDRYFAEMEAAAGDLYI